MRALHALLVFLIVWTLVTDLLAWSGWFPEWFGVYSEQQKVSGVLISLPPLYVQWLKQTEIGCLGVSAIVASDYFLGRIASKRNERRNQK